MLLCPWDFPGKSTGVGCHFLLQWFYIRGTNRFKVPDLVHRVSEELWMEVCNTIQEAVIKTIPKKKKHKKAKWLSEEVLQITEERTEVKGKGEREWCTQLNAELQRIARRDEKTFLSEQCQEIEENSSVRKTRDCFKRIGAIKETFHAMMGMIKDRNGKDLTQEEGVARIHKRTI